MEGRSHNAGHIFPFFLDAEVVQRIFTELIIPAWESVSVPSRSNRIMFHMAYPTNSATHVCMRQPGRRLGHRPSHDDIVGTDFPRLFRRRHPHLIAHVAIGKPHPRRYGEERFPAGPVDLTRLQGGQTTPSSPASRAHWA